MGEADCRQGTVGASTAATTKLADSRTGWPGKGDVTSRTDVVTSENELVETRQYKESTEQASQVMMELRKAETGTSRGQQENRCSSLFVSLFSSSTGGGISDVERACTFHSTSVQQHQPAAFLRLTLPVRLSSLLHSVLFCSVLSVLYLVPRGTAICTAGGTNKLSTLHSVRLPAHPFSQAPNHLRTDTLCRFTSFHCIAIPLFSTHRFGCLAVPQSGRSLCGMFHCCWHLRR